jgi:drug/metabolite transporter (DMT)-like permease
VHCEYTYRYGYIVAMAQAIPRTDRPSLPRTDRPSLPRTDLLAGAALVVMWSSGFIGAALGTRYAAADTLLAWRYLCAAALLAVLATVLGARRPGRRPGRRAVLRQGGLGLLCQVGYLGGVVTGVGLGVPAGTAALVAALQPLVVATAAGPLLGERTGRRQAGGLVLALAGVALVVGDDLRLATAPPWAYLLPVAGMLALAAGTLLERRLRPPEHLLDALTLQTLTAAACFVVGAGLGGRLAPPAEAGFWWAVAWTVGLSTFGGYGSYLLVLRRGGANRVSTLLYLTPPTTALWAFWMFGERPGAPALLGMATCAAGVYLALSRRRRATTPGPRPAGATAHARGDTGEIPCST